MLLGNHKGKGAIALLDFLESKLNSEDKSSFSKLLNDSDINGQTILHFATALASTIGYIKIVEWLIGKMTHEVINAGDNNGNTALYTAVKGGNAQIIKLLIKKVTYDTNTNKVTSYLDLIYSIGNKTPVELYDDNGIVKQEFSQILKQAFALLMEPKVIKESYDFEGIIYLVHSKVNELEQSGVKGLIDNKLQELQHIQKRSSSSRTFSPP